MAFVVLIASVPEQRRQVLPLLQSNGHVVYVAERIESGQRLVDQHAPDVVVVATEARTKHDLGLLLGVAAGGLAALTPAILLTPHVEENDRILAYELGASDVIAYPVGARELGLRVDAVTGRRAPTASTSAVLEFGGLRLDGAARRTFCHGDEKHLTVLEFDLLMALMRCGGRVLGRAQLLGDVWNGRLGGETRTVDSHVKRLRRKLGSCGACVETVRGAGYRLAGRARAQEREDGLVRSAALARRELASAQPPAMP